MTNSDILRIAAQQSAIDLGCCAEDFFQEENRIVRSAENEQARRYLKLPFACNLVSYGSNIVASVSEEAEAAVAAYIGKYPFYHCFETPNLHALDDALYPLGLRSCFMAEYFLPDVSVLKPLPCRYETKLLTPEDFSGLYLPQWSNALCAARPHLDVLAVGAYADGELIGLAGCSGDCDTCDEGSNKNCDRNCAECDCCDEDCCECTAKDCCKGGCCGSCEEQEEEKCGGDCGCCCGCNCGK